MSKFDKAAKDLRRFAEQFNGIMALAEALENIPSIDQAATESQARLDILRQQEREIADRNAQAAQNVVKIAADAEAYADKVRAEADAYKKNLETDCKQLEMDKTAALKELDTIAKKRDEVRAQIAALREKIS